MPLFRGEGGVLTVEKKKNVSSFRRKGGFERCQRRGVRSGPRFWDRREGKAARKKARPATRGGGGRSRLEKKTFYNPDLHAGIHAGVVLKQKKEEDRSSRRLRGGKEKKGKGKILLLYRRARGNRRGGEIKKRRKREGGGTSVCFSCTEGKGGADAVSDVTRIGEVWTVNSNPGTGEERRKKGGRRSPDKSATLNWRKKGVKNRT